MGIVDFAVKTAVKAAEKAAELAVTELLPALFQNLRSRLEESSEADKKKKDLAETAKRAEARGAVRIGVAVKGDDPERKRLDEELVAKYKAAHTALQSVPGSPSLQEFLSKNTHLLMA